MAKSSPSFTHLLSLLCGGWHWSASTRCLSIIGSLLSVVFCPCCAIVWLRSWWCCWPCTGRYLSCFQKEKSLSSLSHPCLLRCACAHPATLIQCNVLLYKNAQGNKKPLAFQSHPVCLGKPVGFLAYLASYNIPPRLLYSPAGEELRAAVAAGL